jgi:hypothetical protein
MDSKKLLLVLLAAGSTTLGFSQIRFGVKGGLNIATLNGTYPPNVDHKSQIGFHVGATAEKEFSASGFSLVAEALVSTQGGVTEQYSYDNVDKYSQTLKTTYINVPVYLKYLVFTKLSVEAGPQFGFAIAAKNKLEYTNSVDPSLNQTLTIDQMNDGAYNSGGIVYPYKAVRSVDIGMILGVTYDVTDALYVQAHYNYGITDVDTRTAASSGFGFLNSWKIKNAVFQFSAGYRFN